MMVVYPPDSNAWLVTARKVLENFRPLGNLGADQL